MNSYLAPKCSNENLLTDVSIDNMDFLFFDCRTNHLISGNVEIPLIRHSNLDNSVSGQLTLLKCHYMLLLLYLTWALRFIALTWAHEVNKSPLGCIFCWSVVHNTLKNRVTCSSVQLTKVERDMTAIEIWWSWISNGKGWWTRRKWLFLLQSRPTEIEKDNWNWSKWDNTIQFELDALTQC